MRNSISLRAVLVLAAAFLGLAAGTARAGVTYYWDVNGTTAGFSTVVGTWDGVNNYYWNSDSTGGGGGALIVAPTSDDDLIIPQATTNTGSLTVSGTQNAGSITFAANVGPTVTITGGTSITIGGAGSSSGIFENSTGNNTISTALILNSTVSAFSFTDTSSGLLTIGAVTGAATTGTQTITVGSSSSGGITLNGVIGDGAGGGNVALTINNTSSGVTSLTGAASTYSGVTTISAGILDVTTFAAINTNSSIGKGSAGGSAADLVLNGGTLRHSAANVATTNRLFSVGTSGGTIDSSNATAANTLSFTNTGAMDFNGQLGTRTLTLGGSNTGNNTMALLIGNDGSGNATSLTKTGAGTWVLSGTNAYTGPTTLSGGTLSAGVTANLGAAASNLVFNGGTLQVTGVGLTSLSGLGRTNPITFTSGQTVGLDINNAGNVFTADQVLNQGTGGLTKLGAGTLVLNQVNTYTGPTTISSGILNATSSAALGNSSSSNTLIFNGGTLQAGGTITSADTRYVTMTGAGTIDTNSNAVSIAGIIGGTGALTKSGVGTLTLSAANTFSGSTTVSAGTLALTNDLALRNSALVTTGAGTVTLSGTTPTFGGLSGASGNLASVISTGYNLATNLTLNPQSGSVTYGGVIADGATGMALTKTGAGTQVLQGANTYSGATNLNAGILELSGTGSILNSAIAFKGGELRLTNTAAETGSGRVHDTTGITSNGGTLTYNNTSGTAIYAETIGAVTLTSGQLNIVQAVNQAGSQTLTLAGLTHTGASNTSAVTFSAASTGPQASGNKNMFVVTGGGTTTAGQIIGPWATVGTTAALQTDYAVYNSDYVVPAAIVANNDETTWATASNINLGAAATLTASRTLNTLRYSGAVATLALGANSLETYGLLNGGSGLLTVSGTGALTTPAGGGNLYLTAGNNAITVGAPITNSSDSQPVTLVKNGAGTLTLSSTTSNYSGGTVINGGTLSIASNASLGALTAPLTLNANATLPNSINYGTRPVVLNNGAIFYGLGISSFTIGGTITGDGGFAVSNSGPQNGSGRVYLTGTGNTFTGPLVLGGGNYSPAFNVASIGDAPGAGQIQFAGGNNVYFRVEGGSSPIVLNYRQFKLSYDWCAATISNNNISAANTLTVNTDFVVTATANQGVRLGGSNTGTNTFAGRIADGTAPVISVTKVDGGLWILSGANTYTGKTTISAGTLSINSIQDAGSATANALGKPATGANSIIDLASTGTLRYIGTGHSSNRVINLTTAAGGTFTLDASGPSGTFALTGGVANAGTSGTSTVALTGTGLGSQSGAIVNGTSSNVAAVTKSGAGTWTLSGTNTYTGATTVNGGKLLLGQGGSMAATAVSVTGTATYGTSYTSSGNSIAGGKSLSLASGTTLSLQDNSTNTLSFTATGTGTLSGADLYFDLGAAGACDTLALASTATVTNSNTFYFNALGSLKTGNDAYTLITAGGFSGAGTFAIGTTLPQYTLTLDIQATGVYLNVALNIIPGDTNDDKVVDAADYISIKTNFGLSGGAEVTRLQGDLVDDNVVDWADLQELMNAMGTRSVGGAPATPEPATLGLLAIGALALLRRRRK